MRLSTFAKYKVNERLNLGLAWTFHFSLSDELDGVKDPYWVKTSFIFHPIDIISFTNIFGIINSLFSVNYSL